MKSLYSQNTNVLYPPQTSYQQQDTSSRNPEGIFASPMPSGSEINNSKIESIYELKEIIETVTRSKLTTAEKENSLIMMFHHTISHPSFYQKIERLNSLVYLIKGTILSSQQKQNLIAQFLLSKPDFKPTWSSSFVEDQYLIYANHIAQSNLSSEAKQHVREHLIERMIAECHSPRCPDSNASTAIGFHRFISEFSKKDYFVNQQEENLMLKHFINRVIEKSCAFCDDTWDLSNTILKIGTTSLDVKDKAQFIVKLTDEFNRTVVNHERGETNIKLKEVILTLKNSSLDPTEKNSIILLIKNKQPAYKTSCSSFFSRIFHRKNHQSKSDSNVACSYS